MSDNFINAMVAMVGTIVGLATIAVLVSKNANTSSVIQSASSGLSTDIATAVSPVTGSSGIGSLGTTGGLPLQE